MEDTMKKCNFSAQARERMVGYKQVKIIGNAHWSARGELESEMWGWGLEVDGEFVTKDNYLEIRTPEAKQFYEKLKPYLPVLSEHNPCFDGGIPGGTWIFQMPLEKTRDPRKVKDILIKYFPQVFENDKREVCKIRKY